ncbi:MAG: hydrogen peroxide-dependent heme synthase [Actinomycetota bacterium]
MAEQLVFAAYPVFRALPERLAAPDRDVAAKEVEELLEAWSNRVETRGAYSMAGFRADADMMFWWVARDVEDVQALTAELRRTRLGRALTAREVFLGLVRPAEFTPDHLPAFVQGRPPERFLCVYPFVRTPDWYLLSPEERGRYLREHGEAGRRYPDVLANTTSAFGLGDYEWILAFEARSPDRIVELIRHLRGTEARRFTKLETPFFTGIRKGVGEVVADLPEA